MISPGTAHGVVGYPDEGAIYGYTEHLAGVDDGSFANLPAPKVAIGYWNLPADALA
jgi:ubiquinol oxidase